MTAVAISSATVDAMLAVRDLGPDTARASVHPCQASKFHSPRPLTTTRHSWGTRSYWLCGNCLTNLEIYLLLMSEGSNGISWETQREFGNEIRRIGREILG